MISKIFLDTNILLDVLLEREPFFNISQRVLVETVEVLIIDKTTIQYAITSGLKDFEDAVQIMACKAEGIDLILTRNQKDFINDWIEVQSPEEYLNLPG